MYPETINNLIECFKKLPGIGAKTAERLSLSCLNIDEETLDIFSKALSDVKRKIKKCSVCGNYTEEEVCSICKDNARDRKIICVVEESKNILAFEKIGKYNGLYHVLGGLISPLDGINPEDINIMSLMERIEKEKPEEIIVAVKPTIEGETTALYIQKIFENKKIIVSKLAHGVPIGADIEYMDPLTLEIAMNDRSKLS